MKNPVIGKVEDEFEPVVMCPLKKQNGYIAVIMGNCILSCTDVCEHLGYEEYGDAIECNHPELTQLLNSEYGKMVASDKFKSDLENMVTIMTEYYNIHQSLSYPTQMKVSER